MAGTCWSRLFAVVGVRPRGLPSIGACNFPIYLGIVNCVLQYDYNMVGGYGYDWTDGSLN